MQTATKSRSFTRRAFLRGVLAAGLTLGGAAAYTRVFEPRWLDVTTYPLPIANLPAALDGFRIAQISDIHLSKYLAPEHLAWTLTQVQAADVDVLALTGDFVGGDLQSVAGLVEPLAAFDRPVYAIHGNHDVGPARPTVRRYLRLAGVQLLANTAREIAGGLWLAGIDDALRGRPDLTAALSDIPSGATTVLLAHEPDFFDHVLALDAPVALQLSGHSHGGQVRLPSLEPDPSGLYSYAPLLPKLARRYPIGLRTVGPRTVYTNRGLGVWPFPYRFNCRPEVTIFTLKAA